MTRRVIMRLARCFGALGLTVTFALTGVVGCQSEVGQFPSYSGLYERVGEPDLVPMIYPVPERVRELVEIFER